MDAVDLPMDVEFSIHAAAFAIQGLDRDELEEESHNQERSDQVVLTGEIDAKEHLHL